MNTQIWSDIEYERLFSQEYIEAAALSIRDKWTPIQRKQRAMALVDSAFKTGLRLPPIESIGPSPVRVLVCRKLVEGDHTHADCPYWMHDPMPKGDL